MDRPYPVGYVLNTCGHPSSDYLILHKAMAKLGSLIRNKEWRRILGSVMPGGDNWAKGVRDKRLNCLPTCPSYKDSCKRGPDNTICTSDWRESAITATNIRVLSHVLEHFDHYNQGDYPDTGLNQESHQVRTLRDFLSLCSRLMHECVFGLRSCSDGRMGSLVLKFRADGNDPEYIQITKHADGYYLSWAMERSKAERYLKLAEKSEFDKRDVKANVASRAVCSDDNEHIAVTTRQAQRISRTGLKDKRTLWHLVIGTSRRPNVNWVIVAVKAFMRKRAEADFDADVARIPATEAKALAKQRRGQELLRLRLLSEYRHQCAMCDVNNDSLLRASHIVPWNKRVSTRLRPENVILLCGLHDLAFENGFITISDDYRLRLPRGSSGMAEVLRKITNGDRKLRLPQSDLCRPKVEYLRWHRENVGKR